MPVALITGIAGQDGSYLAELLLSHGYRVVGIAKQTGESGLARLAKIREKITVVDGDLLIQEALVTLLQTHRPDEIYNLAAESFMPDYAGDPGRTGNVTALSVTRLLEAIRIVNPHIRFLQASSSEMFGRATVSPQNETTPLNPRNLYAIAKVYAHQAVRYYRETYGLFACSGILFNHESPRRSLKFVSRRVTYEAARIKLGLSKRLHLGDLDARRDWGYAGDYVKAMCQMLRQQNPEDYVIATGRTHSVRELCEAAFAHLGLDYRDHVVRSNEHVRPTEEALIVGDSSKAAQLLGWKPTIPFEELIKMMADADQELVNQGGETC